MKTILITGGAGFLGSCLAETLLKKGYQVVAIDDLSHGRLRNISDLIPFPSFIFHQKDILEIPFLMEISQGVDLVVHFATYKIPREGDALKTMEVNTRGTEIVLEAARERKIPVLFGSTDDVYGINPELPFSEESALVIGNSKSFRWSDAISKAYSEQLCFAYQEAFQVPINILRFAIVYGPKTAEGLVGRTSGRLHRQGPEERTDSHPRRRSAESKFCLCDRRGGRNPEGHRERGGSGRSLEYRFLGSPPDPRPRL